MPNRRLHIKLDKYLIEKKIITSNIDFNIIHDILDDWQPGDAWGLHHDQQKIHHDGYLEAIINGDKSKVYNRIEEKIQNLMQKIDQAGNKDDYIISAKAHIIIDKVFRDYKLNNKSCKMTNKEKFDFAKSIDLKKIEI